MSDSSTRLDSRFSDTCVSTAVILRHRRRHRRHRRRAVAAPSDDDDDRNDGAAAVMAATAAATIPNPTTDISSIDACRRRQRTGPVKGARNLDPGRRHLNVVYCTPPPPRHTATPTPTHHRAAGRVWERGRRRRRSLPTYIIIRVVLCTVHDIKSSCRPSPSPSAYCLLALVHYSPKGFVVVVVVVVVVICARFFPVSYCIPINIPYLFLSHCC